jgi:hypothetical protein
MRTAVAFAVGGIVTAALLLARPSPAAPNARWEYRILDVDAPGRTQTFMPIEGETETERAKRIAADPLLVSLTKAESEGWDLVSATKDGDSPFFTYFLRRPKP